MRKTLRVTLDVVVEDLDREARRECAKMDGIPLRDLPGLKDAEASELADVIAGAVECGVDEFFGGSGIFATFTGATVVSAEFASPPRYQGEQP